MTSVQREIVLDVLDRFSKKRPNLRVIHSPYSPEEVIIVDEDFIYCLKFPEEMPVPRQTLQLLSAILGIPMNIFYHPEWLDLQ